MKKIVVKGIQVINAWERVMKGRIMSWQVKKGIRNSIMFSTLTYA